MKTITKPLNLSKINTILFLFLFIAFSAINGQPISSLSNYIADVQHYTVEQGLSNNWVNCVHKDKRGFIWVGTKYGLNRFDGKKFDWFTKEKQGLSSNIIVNIQEDNDGWLWVSVPKDEYTWSRDVKFSDNLFFINIYTLEIQTIEERFGTSFPEDISQFRYLVNASNGDNYLSFINKIYRYNNITSTFQLITDKTEDLYELKIIQDQQLIGLVKPSQPNLVQDLIEIDLDGKIKSRTPLPTANNRIFIDRTKNIHITGRAIENEAIHRIVSIDPNHQAKISSTPNGVPQIPTTTWDGATLYDSSKDIYWFYGGGRFFVFHIEDGLLYDFGEDFPNLSKEEIWNVFFDGQGITWVSTDNGLYKVQLFKNPFQKYLALDVKQHPLIDLYSTRGILEDEKTLYANILNAKGRHAIGLLTNEIELLPQHYLPTGDPIFPFPLSILKRKNGNILSSQVDVVERMSNKEEVIQWKNKDGEFINGDLIWSLYEDKNNKVWLGLAHGLGYIDEEQKRLRYFKNYRDFEMLAKGIVYDFFEFSNEKILLATTTGVYIFHLEEGVLNRFWTGGEGKLYFPHDNIYHIHQDKSGDFWIATGGGGLIHCQITEEKIEVQEQYTIADGLANNTIYAVYEDDFNNLWMSSDYGIIQFNKETGNSKGYTVKDGITHNEFNRISHYQAADGRLYFGGLNGITAFYPKDLVNSEADTNIPLEIVKYQQYSNRSKKLVDKTEDLVVNSQIQLKPGDRFFDIEFALLNFKNSEHIKYAYQVKGVDKDWNYLNDNSIRISGLPYGNYQLIVKGQSGNGVFSTKQLVIPISVIRPIYLRWWFIFLVIISISYGISYYFNARNKRLILQKEKLEQQVEERTLQIKKDKAIIEQQATELKQLDEVKTRFFANVSHELRTPLTLILSPLKTVLNSQQLNNKNYTLISVAQQNSKKLLNLVNEILDLTKLEKSKLELDETAVSCYQILKRIVSSFESYADAKGVEFEFQYNADEYLNLKLDINKFEKIINNLLSNAFKFTGTGGNVTLIVQERAKDILIEVKDTGRGITVEDLPHVFNRFYQTKQKNAAAEGGTGIGLALSNEYAKLMKGKLSVESQFGKGSTFSFIFPKKEVVGMVLQNQSSDEENQVISSIAPLTVQSNLNNEKKSTILIVEDNKDLREFIELLLSPHYNIISAENGKKALEELNKNIPSLIISDMMMPEMDGMQLLQYLKSDEKYNTIPTIMLTARAEMKDKLKALRLGVDDYMTKPFEEEELFARISNLLKNASERTKWITEVEPELEALTKSPRISKEDTAWLADLEIIVNQQLAQFEFGTQTLAEEVNLSRTQLFRRLKKLTGLTPSQYIKEARLHQARTYFENKKYNSVKAVAYSVGYKQTSKFSKSYKERFGKLPSEIL